jgi:hypothetical protein
MGYVCLVLAITALGAIVYLLRVEYVRFHADPSPAPPPLPEKAALQPWHARMAMLIAGLSVLGALLVWQASSTFGTASNLSQQVLQDTTQYQTELAVQNSRIEFGARLSLLYQDDLFTETQLYKLARSYRSINNVNEALQLEAEARVDGAQERAFDPGFLYYSPTASSSGAVTYSPADEETVAEEQNRDLITLDPAHATTIESQVSADRSKGQRIVLATALFVAAVFFLTVANLGWRHRRIRTMIPGVLAVVAGVAVLAVAVV